MNNTENMTPILDEDTLSTLQEIMQDELLEIIHVFIMTIPSELEKLKAANGENDIKAVIAITHTIKGASGNIGASYLSFVCDKLESGLRQNKIEEPTEFIEEIEIGLSKTIEELKNRFKQEK